MEELFPALEAKESKGSERCRERPHTAATNQPGQRRMARLIILLFVVPLDLESTRARESTIQGRREWTPRKEGAGGRG
jgi:hypothetical protein